MSKRGIDFLDYWLAEHLADTTSPGVDDLLDQIIAAARTVGISAYEMTEETGNLFTVISAALEHRDAGAPE